MTTETTEYARFGPWVDEVTTPDDVPRLYRDHPIDLTSTRLVLKVPRNIARRDAHPGMDLYDHLLVLDDARLTVLSRTVTPARRGACAWRTTPRRPRCSRRARATTRGPARARWRGG